MENTPTNYVQYATRNGAYIDLEALQQGYGAWDTDRFDKNPEAENDSAEALWENSGLNPINRINDLTMNAACTWRVDGSERAGMRFIATPVFSESLRPTRIDVYIPNPSGLPWHLRRSLGIGHNTHIRDKRVRSLGVHHHLVRALDIWSRKQKDFENFYRSLPFGSRIVFQNISLAPKDMEAVVEYSGLHRELLTQEELEDKFGMKEMPSIVQLEQLSLIHGINENVCLVEVAVGENLPDQYIFKSSTTKPEDVYYEIGLLLSLSPSPYILEAPLRVVGMQCPVSSRCLIVGMLLRYHPLGSLRDNLPRLASAQGLQLITKVEWASQLTRALIFLRDKHGIFYSDLKTENVLIAKANRGGEMKGDRKKSNTVVSIKELSQTRIVLIDFQQSGAPNAWTAPEVYWKERLIFLWRKSANQPDRRKQYEEMMKVLLPSEVLSRMFTNNEQLPAQQATQMVWNSSTNREKEAATVFALGKVLWCIFEGVGCVTPMMNASYSWEEKSLAIEFPEFSSATPPLIRDLILKCTKGAREYAQRDLSRAYIRRVGDYLYPGDKAGRQLRGEKRATAGEFVAAAREYWLNEMSDLENFVTARRQARGYEHVGEAMDLQAKNQQYLSYLQRPSLQNVLDVLETISKR